MPNKLSTWIDICVTLIVSLILLVILFQYKVNSESVWKCASDPLEWKCGRFF